MDIQVLDREIYSEAEAARLLRVAPSTLHYWLEGGVRRGKRYRPVIREEPKGERSVTWAEFVEAGLLRQYRREHGVPMSELRLFIDCLREKLGVPYPLAHERPFVGVGRQLVVEAQEESGLDTDFFLVAFAREQLVLTAASQAFVDRVTWEDQVAAAWRPHDDLESPVRVSPLQRFGRPAVAGISTEVLWEHEEAGESVDEVATGFWPDRARRALGSRLRELASRGVSARAKPADVRFYFDADVLGVAKIVARLRPDITYPGDPGAVVHKSERAPCPITDPATLDREWIPLVASAGWLIVTRDSHIQDRRAEIAAVQEYGAKMVALAGRALSTPGANLRFCSRSGGRSSRCPTSQDHSSTPLLAQA